MKNEEWPFPVPEHVRQDLESNSRWKWWVKRWGAEDNGSTGLHLMSLWHSILEEQLAGLDALVEPISTNPYGDHENQIQGMVHALILLAQDFKDLWDFTSETMPYDPGARQRVREADQFMTQHGETPSLPTGSPGNVTPISPRSARGACSEGGCDGRG